MGKALLWYLPRNEDVCIILHRWKDTFFLFIIYWHTTVKKHFNARFETKYNLYHVDLIFWGIFYLVWTKSTHLSRSPDSSEQSLSKIRLKHPIFLQWKMFFSLWLTRLSWQNTKIDRFLSSVGSQSISVHLYVVGDPKLEMSLNYLFD